MCHSARGGCAARFLAFNGGDFLRQVRNFSKHVFGGYWPRDNTCVETHRKFRAKKPSGWGGHYPVHWSLNAGGSWVGRSCVMVKVKGILQSNIGHTK